MEKPSNDQLREYARSENNYILSLLFKPPNFKDEEKQVMKLSLRNVEATTRCFGKADLLHIMALNTLGYIYLEKGSNIIKARDVLTEAAVLCQINKYEKEELFLETTCLLINAKIRSGISPATAILEHFEGKKNQDLINEIQESARILNEQLTKTVFGVNLKEILLIISLKEISLALMQFVKERDKKVAELIHGNLLLFIKTYY